MCRSMTVLAVLEKWYADAKDAGWALRFSCASRDRKMAVDWMDGQREESEREAREKRERGRRAERPRSVEVNPGFLGSINLSLGLLE